MTWLTAEQIAAEKALSLRKQTEEAKLSVQARSKGETVGGASVLYVLSKTGGTVPPWWSRDRDLELRRFEKRVDHFAGAIYSISAKLQSVPFRVEPRDPSVKNHWRQAEDYDIRLAERSEYGQGWAAFFSKWLHDLWVQDNGAFAEVIGAGKPDGPIKGPAVGLANLDSVLCQRTSDPEYPVVYQDTDSKRYKLHHTRVIYASQLPSPSAVMHGVGFGWLSRCISVAQGLSDVLQYKQEKMGSRPRRAIIYGSGLDTDLLHEAVEASNEAADNAGLARYSMTPVLASTSGDISLDVLDLASLPDGFDYESDVTLGMYAIALAGGFPPRWLWPATSTGATKADALLQHTAMSVSGASDALNGIKVLLGGSDKGKRHSAGKFLPPQLKLVFDFQDDEQDRAEAEIRDRRSMTNERDVNDGLITVRVARERMLGDGDVTDAQFAEMEMQSGRTEDGRSITDVLYGDNPYTEGIDPDSPDPILVEERLSEAKRTAATATSGNQRREAKVAVAALEALQTASMAIEEENAEMKQPETCVCPGCGHEQAKVLGTPCRSVKCPECGAMMLADLGLKEVVAPIRMALDNYEKGMIDAGKFAEYALECAMEIKAAEEDS